MYYTIKVLLFIQYILLLYAYKQRCKYHFRYACAKVREIVFTFVYNRYILYISSLINKQHE